jgi:hypothetical protein
MSSIHLNSFHFIFFRAFFLYIYRRSVRALPCFMSNHRRGSRLSLFVCLVVILQTQRFFPYIKKLMFQCQYIIKSLLALVLLHLTRKSTFLFLDKNVDRHKTILRLYFTSKRHIRSLSKMLLMLSHYSLYTKSRITE